MAATEPDMFICFVYIGFPRRAIVVPGKCWRRGQANGRSTISDSQHEYLPLVFR